ncbi:fasciclin-like arabinogalactan protein 14 [Aristolochia californica]|uniref:fasciclin-like arabinogalactan protein 14 n=1 Tax=Aristolochia californica TaxID=171875 RepID=UPI0035D5678F
MASSSSFLILSLFLLSSSALAFNITKILEAHGDFSIFNGLLTRSELANEINRRKTITVLAVDNVAAGALFGKPADVLKRLLSVHVVLDYYDMEKLGKMSNKSVILTTLFQSTGVNQQGLLNIMKNKSGEFRLVSAVHGAGLTSNVVKDVETHPYNISVLQVSGVIYPTGIENENSTAVPSPPKASPPVSAPSLKRRKIADLSPDATDPSSYDYDVEEAPTPGVGPSAAEAPVSDDARNDASLPGSSSHDTDASSASRAALSLLGVVMGIIYQTVG